MHFCRVPASHILTLPVSLSLIYFNISFILLLYSCYLYTSSYYICQLCSSLCCISVNYIHSFLASQSIIHIHLSQPSQINILCRTPVNGTHPFVVSVPVIQFLSLHSSQFHFLFDRSLPVNTHPVTVSWTVTTHLSYCMCQCRLSSYSAPLVTRNLVPTASHFISHFFALQSPFSFSTF